MKKLALLLTASALCLSPLSTNAESIDTGFGQSSDRIVGYLPDWSYQEYEDIDISSLTHINISFCNPDSNGELFCYIPDGEFHKIVSTAHENGVEVFAALGGGGGCNNYLQYIDTDEEMKTFSENIINYCNKYNLDGIDLDIELGAYDPIWNYYGNWCAELRKLCDENGFEMSTATAHWVAEKVSPETFELFDFVNVMAYDNDLDKVSHSSYEYAEKCLDYFAEEKKIPYNKLVLGVPFYGRGYSDNGSLDWNSYMSFSEILSNGLNNYSSDVYNGIAYNGADTIKRKAELSRIYGGIMIWELTLDAKGDFSLLKVIKDVYHNQTSQPESVAGDVNADGQFNISDIVMLQKWILADPDVNLADWKAADLCEDGVINTFDLVMMKRLLISQN